MTALDDAIETAAGKIKELYESPNPDSRGILKDLCDKAVKLHENGGAEKPKVTPEGQFANKVFHHWCDKLYPATHNGDKYVGKPKAEIPYLMSIVKATKNMDAREWDKRLRNYTTSTSTFHLDNGHRLLDFKWNAWSDDAMRKRIMPKGSDESESPAYMRGHT